MGNQLAESERLPGGSAGGGGTEKSSNRGFLRPTALADTVSMAHLGMEVNNRFWEDNQSSRRWEANTPRYRLRNPGRPGSSRSYFAGRDARTYLAQMCIDGVRFEHMIHRWDRPPHTQNRPGAVVIVLDGISNSWSLQRNSQSPGQVDGVRFKERFTSAACGTILARKDLGRGPSLLATWRTEGPGTRRDQHGQ